MSSRDASAPCSVKAAAAAATSRLWLRRASARIGGCAGGGVPVVGFVMRGVPGSGLKSGDTPRIIRSLSGDSPRLVARGPDGDLGARHNMHSSRRSGMTQRTAPAPVGDVAPQVPAPGAAMEIAARRSRHPGLALAVIMACQLMVILDATIVNIALPNIQHALHFSITSLSWVLNAYTLTFGGLLLLGGRAGDILGRRRAFVAGLLLFSLASLLGGFATSAGWLLAARALQGVGGAIAAPTALALIATALLAPLFIQESDRQPGRFDLAGALTSTAGMTSLVYGFIRAASNGWSDGLTLGTFALAVGLLAVFVTIELRTSQPITPLHLFANRNRTSAHLTRLLLLVGMFGMFFFLTQFVQTVLGFSPLKAGFVFLPLTVAVFGSARAASRLLPRFGPKSLTVGGIAVTAIGMLWLAQVSATTSYLFGVGIGFPFVALTLVALSGVEPRDTGAASSLVNVVQQVGGSLGLAILVTVFGSATRNAASHSLAGAGPQAQARDVLVHGIGSAFTAGAVFTIAALLMALLAIGGKPSVPVRRPAAAV